MLKKDLIKRIEELEKENQELKVQNQNEVAAMFAVTSAMQMIMGNQVGKFIPSEKEGITISRYPDEKKFEGKIASVELRDKKYKVDEELKVGEIGYLEGKLVLCTEEIEEQSCRGCYFRTKACFDVICAKRHRKDNTGVIFQEVTDED